MIAFLNVTGQSLWTHEVCTVNGKFPYYNYYTVDCRTWRHRDGEWLWKFSYMAGKLVYTLLSSNG